MYTRFIRWTRSLLVSCWNEWKNVGRPKNRSGKQEHSTRRVFLYETEIYFKNLQLYLVFARRLNRHFFIGICLICSLYKFAFFLLLEIENEMKQVLFNWQIIKISKLLRTLVYKTRPTLFDLAMRNVPMSVSAPNDSQSDRSRLSVEAWNSSRF